MCACVQLRFTLVGLAFAVFLSSPGAHAQPKVAGAQLVSRTGLTLYVFDNDVAGSGRSVCNPPCSNLFRPYAVEKGAQSRSEFTAITRDDGTRQWAWKGRPLYLWYGDEKPGQAGGDGINHNLWHVARP
jgi:predicted lipoprotein with Yx(FWY)xxD motif